ncbi:family 65 glycosyl hydrolase, partial [bacterium F11]
MIHRERIDFPDYVYPADPWRMVENRFYPRFQAATETIFSTANGYLGMRGTYLEGMPVIHGGTFVNGFYESWPISYAENAFGFARTGQTIVNVPDTSVIRLYVDDEPFTLTTANLLKFERALNMKEGTLDRDVIWETPAGKQVLIKSRRIVSFEHRHLAAVSYEITLLNNTAPVLISSKMVYHQSEKGPGNDPRRARKFSHEALTNQNIRTKDKRVVWGFETTNSRMSLGCGIDHLIETDCPYTYELISKEHEGKAVFNVEGQKGKPIKITKLIAYHTSRRTAVNELCDRTARTLDRGLKIGFESILESQKAYMNDFWRRSDVEIQGDAELQQAIRFNLFQICQATARAEGVGVPAKGLTGDGYEGHYFWDAEIYVLPFLIFTNPRIARNLLKFRYSYLDKARERAKQVNQKGALFPWRTINGEEASAYYAAGTAQYHINADIIYAMRNYVEATGDEEFLYEVGAEMLIETARLWCDLGFYSGEKGGKFVIQGVTGPDEYNTVVNNNTYTNLMARENLWYAASTLKTLQRTNPARFGAIVNETKLNLREIQDWQKAADAMFIPYDKKLCINPQDDDFLGRKEWDFENTPFEKYPLLLHYHPLVIYRHRVIKQADVLLALFLLGNEFT